MYEIISAHCNKCGGSRKHSLLHSAETSWNEDLDEGRWISGADKYYLIQCRGCDSIHLKHDNWFSETVGPDGTPETRTVYYPPAFSRRKPEWLGGFHSPFWGGFSNIEKSLSEIYTALQNDCRQLVAIGIRSLLEGVMIEKVGDSGSIGKNVKNFFDSGYVSSQDQKLFNDFLMEAGHAAMHRGYIPDHTALGTLLDLTESLIASIYVHPHRAAGLSGTIPPRTSP